MKKTICAFISALSLAFTGCTTVVTPAGDKTTYANSPWGIVNNTGYDLDVVQDGAKIGRLATGQSIMLPSLVWRESSLVSVSAYSDGKYMGASSYTFSRYTVYNWQIDCVTAPEGAR